LKKKRRGDGEERERGREEEEELRCGREIDKRWDRGEHAGDVSPFPSPSLSLSPSFSLPLSPCLLLLFSSTLLYPAIMDAVKRFFSCPRFAVAGASADPSKFGYKRGFKA
jgi:hypothetical protein